MILVKVSKGGGEILLTFNMDYEEMKALIPKFPVLKYYLTREDRAKYDEVEILSTD